MKYHLLRKEVIQLDGPSNKENSRPNNGNDRGSINTHDEVLSQFLKLANQCQAAKASASMNDVFYSKKIGKVCKRVNEYRTEWGDVMKRPPPKDSDTKKYRDRAQYANYHLEDLQVRHPSIMMVPSLLINRYGNQAAK